MIDSKWHCACSWECPHCHGCTLNKENDTTPQTGKDEQMWKNLNDHWI